VVERGVASCVRRCSIRLTVPEDSIINRACEALGGLERSQLVQEAALSEANRMGIRWSVDRPPPLTDPWPYLPDRTAEATAVRVTITVSVPLRELVARAAEHVHASEPVFLLGATLAYIGRLQRCFEGAAVGTPEERAEGERMRAALQRIKLPPQYVYRGRRAK
jgi:uncharacterized protein (DUF1778 family)